MKKTSLTFAIVTTFVLAFGIGVLAHPAQSHAATAVSPAPAPAPVGVFRMVEATPVQTAPSEPSTPACFAVRHRCADNSQCCGGHYCVRRHCQ